MQGRCIYPKMGSTSKKKYAGASSMKKTGASKKRYTAAAPRRSGRMMNPKRG